MRFEEQTAVPSQKARSRPEELSESVFLMTGQSLLDRSALVSAPLAPGYRRGWPAFLAPEERFL